MKPGFSRFLATTAIGAPIALGMIAQQAAAQDIGKVAAVNPQMDGTPPTSSVRSLQLGSGVVQNERIETTDDGSGQLLFVDQTSLSIAPRSEIVLDKYVYDSGEDVGEVALTMTKGVLRLIGGRITKKREGIIRTPTATIGVRGGLALVIVSNGVTRVCHVAGEYTRVNADAGGELVLSRTNACAVVQQGQKVNFGGLITSQELAEIYAQIEGRGTGGTTLAANAIDVANVEQVNSGIKTGPNDQPVSTSGHRFPVGEQSGDENTERQNNTESDRVVQIPLEELPEPVQEIILDETPVFEEPLEEPIFFVTGLSGGTAINSGFGTQGSTFFQVLQGSLIGETFDGNELRIPVPDTDGVNDAFFDTDNILSNFLSENVEFTAVDLAPGSGLFEFFIGDEEFDEDTGIQIGGSFSSVLGDIEGVGFTDPFEQFTYVEFSDDDFDPAESGFGVFGSPQFGQSQFAAGDATLLVSSNAPGRVTAVINNSLLTPELRNGIVNTVEGFQVQPNTFLNVVRETEPVDNVRPFFMVGNQGFARYARSDTIIVASDAIVGEDLTGGGKWLHGDLYIGDSDASGETSVLSVFADDIRSYEGSGPIVSGTLLSSGSGTFEDPETGDLNELITFERVNLGSFEDSDGNTIFGEDNRYMVLSNLHRPGLEAGASVPPAFDNDPGSAVGLVQVDGDVTFDGSSNLFDEISGEIGDHNALLARDRSIDEIINSPLPLAGVRMETFYDLPLENQVDVLDRGFAAGLAVCEGGECGDIDNLTSIATGLPDGIDGFSGVYSVRSDTSDDFILNFGSHELVDTDGDGIPETPTNFDTSNSVNAQFTVRSTGVGNVTGANSEDVNFARYNFSGGGTTSAFIDDSRFGVVSEDGTVGIQGGGRSASDSVGSFILASSGLVGDGGLDFPDSVDTTPESVRWGWWSAAIEAPIESSPDRTDIIHLGNWVAGVRNDFFADLIPGGGVATFDGLAVGSMVNLDSFERRVVTGSFDLTYNFNLSTGNINLNIPAASLDANINVSGFSDVFSGNLADTATNTITDVSGAFFANPSSPDVLGTGLADGIAAVGGTFDSVNMTDRTQTTGIFAGDRASYTPGILVGTPGPDTAGITTAIPIADIARSDR